MYEFQALYLTLIQGFAEFNTIVNSGHLVLLTATVDPVVVNNLDTATAVYLALIQGITEFLPVSSSGHLVLYPIIAGQQVQNVAFDVAVHFGSLIAVILYFRKDIVSLTADWGRSIGQRQQVGESSIAWAVLWATVPIGIVGLNFHYIYDAHYDEAITFSGLILALFSICLIYFIIRKKILQIKYSLFALAVVASLIAIVYFMGVKLRESAFVVATTTIVFGIALLMVDLMKPRTRKLSDINWKDVLIIGIAQTIALIPGTSRSGITITAALMIGINRKDAARFSFLISIPAILLAAGAEFYKISTDATKVNLDWTVLSIGIAVSAITAYCCIYLFIKFIERIGMIPFVAYRLLLGAGLFYFIYVGTIASGL